MMMRLSCPAIGSRRPQRPTVVPYRTGPRTVLGYGTPGSPVTAGRPAGQTIHMYTNNEQE
eukprot:763803-Hanusia_phi.AAC.1